MITELQVKSAKPKDKPYMIRDDRGLYLRVDPTGHKYWILRTWTAGKERKTSLGPYPDLGLKDARIRRDEIQAARARGEDPFSKAPKRPETFAQVVNDWLHSKMAAKSPGYLRVVRLRLNKFVLPHIGDLRLDRITPGEVLRLCRGIEARGTIETAARVRQLIGQVFRFAIAADIAETDPTLALRGALQTAPVRHYATFTTANDARRLMRTIREYPYPIVRAAMLFSLLTFARPGEVRSAEWCEVDTERSEWRIPAEKMKMRRPHIVPLAAQALAVLEELRPISGGGRWLFPSPRNDGRPLSENGVRVALRSIGFTNEQITPHGFRAMASTLLNENGWPPDVIERQLAHVERNQVRAAYNHAEYLSERRRMMQWWADWLDETAASKEADTDRREV